MGRCWFTLCCLLSEISSFEKSDVLDNKSCSFMDRLKNFLREDFLNHKSLTFNSTLLAITLADFTVCHSPYHHDILLVYLFIACLSSLECNTQMQRDFVFLIAFFTVTRRVHTVGPLIHIGGINVIKVSFIYQT